MKKFWKWAVILMTATMAAGLATSCEEKGNTEPEDMGVDISMEITEADASIVYEARTPAGWGLTVNNYVDLTSAIQ